jgi:hypothetical protein
MVACMAVMEKNAWTDARLDDLNARVGKGFDEVKGEVRELRTEMNARFTAMESRFTAIDERFNSFDARFDSMQRSFESLQRTLVVGVITMSASIFGALIVVSS